MSQYITNDQNPNKYFAMIPHMADDDLDPYEYRLYGHYIRVCGKEGKCWESAETTARMCQMSSGKVSQTRMTLAQKGYITIVDRGDKSGGYNIFIIDRMAENIARYTPSGHEAPLQDMKPPPSGHEAKKNHVKEEHNKEESAGATPRTDNNGKTNKEDSSAAKPRKRNLIFEAVSLGSFGVIYTDLPKEQHSRAGTISSQLNKKCPDLTEKELAAGYDYYKQKYPDGELLKSPDTILDWVAQAKQQTNDFNETTFSVEDQFDVEY